MKKYFISLFLSLVVFLAFNASASADVVCQPIYGGGETCVQVGNVFINKTVQNPQTGVFVDNLGVNDPKHSASSNVTFHLTVTNNGESTISKVTVKDILPQFVDFVSGPGNFDPKTKTLTFEIGDLKKGESRTFTVVGKTQAQDKFSQGITCVVNQALANSNDQESSDNSQFCIEKQVLGETTKGGLKVFPEQPVAKTPSTGPEMIALFGLIPTAALGFLLRKKSKSH